MDGRRSEEVYFGEKIGCRQLYQYSHQAFYTNCLQSNSQVIDSTGLRIYAGAQVMIRFVEKYSQLFENQRICELGCGVGAVGLCTCLLSTPKSILLTDGNAEAVELAALNISSWGLSHVASAQQLLWRHTSFDDMKSFDLIIGCELMYYQLDMPLLLTTVRNLLNNSHGLFFHAHIFRKSDQDIELYTSLLTSEWETLEIELSFFISEHELTEHADWSNVRCLVSGPKRVIEEFHYQHPEWTIFRGERQVEDFENPLAIGLEI